MNQDDLLKYWTDIQGTANALSDELLSELDASDKEVLALIQKSLAKSSVQQTIQAEYEKMALLAQKIQQARAKVFAKAEKVTFEVSKQVAGSVQKPAEKLVGKKLKPLKKKEISQVVDYAPYQGKTVREWFSSFQKSDVDRIVASVKEAYNSNLSVADISKKIRETFNVSKRSAEMVARTVINGVANEAKLETFLKNPEVIDGIQFVAMLDGRTTFQCASLDGKIWKCSEKEKIIRPPLHPNCRSTLVPYINTGTDENGNPIEAQRTVPAEDFEAIAKQAHDANPKNKKTWDELSLSVRKSKIYKAEAEYEKDTGKPAYVRLHAGATFKDFLDKQPESFQRSWLGPERYKLYKEGKITFNQLVKPDTGYIVPVAELKKKYGPDGDEGDQSGGGTPQNTPVSPSPDKTVQNGSKKPSSSKKVKVSTKGKNDAQNEEKPTQKADTEKEEQEKLKPELEKAKKEKEEPDQKAKKDKKPPYPLVSKAEIEEDMKKLSEARKEIRKAYAEKRAIEKALREAEEKQKAMEAKFKAEKEAEEAKYQAEQAKKKQKAAEKQIKKAKRKAQKEKMAKEAAQEKANAEAEVRKEFEEEVKRLQKELGIKEEKEKKLKIKDQKNAEKEDFSSGMNENKRYNNNVTQFNLNQPDTKKNPPKNRPEQLPKEAEVFLKRCEELVKERDKELEALRTESSKGGFTSDIYDKQRKILNKYNEYFFDIIFPPTEGETSADKLKKSMECPEREGVQDGVRIFSHIFDSLGYDLPEDLPMAVPTEENRAKCMAGVVEIPFHKGIRFKQRMDTIHEMAHWLEEYGDDYRQKVFDLFERLVDKSQELPIPGKKDEYYYRPKIDMPYEYCTKICRYQGRITGTELVSMFISEIVSDPYEFVKNYPEYYSEMIRLLRK